MPRRRVRTAVEQPQPFEHGRIVGLREAGKTYRRNAVHVRTMYRLCIAASSSGLWNILTPVDQVLDARIVQMHVKIIVQAVVAARTAFTWCITKDHWEPSACSRTQITCASGETTTYTTPPSTATLVSLESRMALCCLQ